MNKGFTLIEIIIVIMIMTLVLGVSAVTYQGTTQEKRLDSDIQKIPDIVRKARDKTVNREIPPGITCTVFNGYSVFFDQPNSRVALRLRCDGVVRQEIRTTFAYSRIESLPAPPELFFDYPLARPNRVFNVTLENRTNNRCKEVVIDLNGNVEDIEDSFVC